MDRRTFLKSIATLSTLGLLPPAIRSLAAGQAAPGGPNILVLVFDTFSAQHATFQGYSRETTPNLARFAERANVYHRHYASGNFTTPGTASLLTGVYPWTHRAMHINGQVIAEYADRNLFAAFAGSGYDRIAYTHNSLVSMLLYQFLADIDTNVPAGELALFDKLLADRFFERDFNAAFLGEKLVFPRQDNTRSSSLILSLLEARDRDGDVNQVRFDNRFDFPRGTPRVEEFRYFLLEDAIDWIQAQVLAERTNPYLMYYHLFPPHGPYNAREDFINKFSDDGFTPPSKPLHPLGGELPPGSLAISQQQYDDYVAYTDAEFGRLLDAMEAGGALQDTCVVVTSDHGQLFERGLHGHITPMLYEGVARIPLLIARPGQTQRADINTPTSAVDVLPSLTYLAGLPLPAWGEGNVLPGLDTATAAPNRPVFTVEAKASAWNRPLAQATVSLVRGNHKLIYYRGYDDYATQYELYDLAADPAELNDLAPAAPAILADLKTQLADAVDAADAVYRR